MLFPSLPHCASEVTSVVTGSEAAYLGDDAAASIRDGCRSIPCLLLTPCREQAWRKRGIEEVSRGKKWKTHNLDPQNQGKGPWRVGFDVALAPRVVLAC